MYHTILVPLDGSKRAEAIIGHVEQIARQNNAKVVLLRVEDEPIMLDRDEVIDFSEYHKKIEQQKKRSLNYLAEIQTRFGQSDIHTEVRIAYGAVVKSILKTAIETQTDLIAMASHGLSGHERVSYGSVAAGVLQASEVPILLIRSHAKFVQSFAEVFAF